MLLLLKLLRKIGKGIRGGISGPQIALSCLLGIWLGITPGFDTLSVLLILLVALLNVNVFLVVVTAMLGKAACYALVPVLFRLGYLVIHSVGLEGMFAAAGDTPVVALLNLHDYCKLGGLIVGVPLALGLAWPLARAVRALRTAICDAEEEHDGFDKAVHSRWMRSVMWLLFGKNRKTAEEALGTRSPMLRRAGWLLVVLLVAIGLLAETLLADEAVRVRLEEGLARRNHAEVNVQDVTVSLFSGRVSVDGLQITDFEKPTHNMFQADSLELRLSLRDLLAGRIVIASVISDSARTDVERASPGWAHPDEDLTEDDRREGEDFGVLIVDYLSDVENVRRIEKYVRRFAQWLEERREAKQRDAAEEAEGNGMGDMAARARERGYLHYLTLSAKHILSRHPVVTIRDLRISGIHRTGDPTIYSITGANWSTQPGRSDDPMAIKVAGDKGLTVDMILHFEEADSDHELTLVLPNREIPTDRLGDKSPVEVTQGRISVGIKDGTFRAGWIKLPVSLAVEDLRLTPREGHKLNRMEQILCENFRHGKLSVTLQGRPWLPRVTIDMSKLLEGLEASGSSILEGVIESELKKLLKDKLPELPDLPDGFELPKLPGFFDDDDDEN